MSIFDSIGKAIGDTFGGAYHAVTGTQNASEKRAMNDQMKAYKEQTELTRKMLDETRNAQQAEKRRVEQKQIRALRGSFRSPGLLGSSVGSGDMNNQLGG